MRAVRRDGCRARLRGTWAGQPRQAMERDCLAGQHRHARAAGHDGAEGQGGQGPAPAQAKERARLQGGVLARPARMEGQPDRHSFRSGQGPPLAALSPVAVALPTQPVPDPTATAGPAGSLPRPAGGVTDREAGQGGRAATPARARPGSRLACCGGGVRRGGPPSVRGSASCPAGSASRQAASAVRPAAGLLRTGRDDVGRLFPRASVWCPGGSAIPSPAVALWPTARPACPVTEASCARDRSAAPNAACAVPPGRSSSPRCRRQTSPPPAPTEMRRVLVEAGEDTAVDPAQPVGRGACHGRPAVPQRRPCGHREGGADPLTGADRR